VLVLVLVSVLVSVSVSAFPAAPSGTSATASYHSLRR